MPFKKYKRLFLVLFFPLLIAGYLLTYKSLEREKDAYIFCNLKNFSACSFAGITGHGTYYDMQKKQSEEWFDIKMAEGDDDGPIGSYILGAKMAITSAKVIRVGYVQANQSLAGIIRDKLPDMKVGIIVGAPKGLLSTFGPEGNYLVCNSLEFTEDRDVFTSHCYSQGWGAQVTYRAYGENMEQVNKIRDSILSIIDDRTHTYRFIQLIAIPIFIYIFLMGSLAAWVIALAVRFIKRADD